MGSSDAFSKLGLELRRGVVVLAALSQLRTPRYGYELRQALADKGMAIEEGTILYWVVAIEGRWRHLTRRIDLAFSLAICGVLSWFMASGPIFKTISTDEIAKVSVALTISAVLVIAIVKLHRERVRRIRSPEPNRQPFA